MNHDLTHQRYEALVASDDRTCFACPTQYEGVLTDGRPFYFRYRHGYATLTVAAEDGDPVSVYRAGGGFGAGDRFGDSLHGYLGVDEYRAVFVTLYNALQEV